MEDEYTEQELADAVEIIEWAAQQPWCNGRVGMMGISWGGFNALQVAALAPDPLKAVVTLCSTDDRYADDIHYKGGCLLNENLGWGATMWSYSSRAPDPALRPDDWRDMWLERLNAEPFLPSVWLKHQVAMPIGSMDQCARITALLKHGFWPLVDGETPIKTRSHA